MVRGAISDGHRWVFIILGVNEGGKGGVYWVTEEVPIGSGYDCLERIKDPEPDVVAGILAHWVCRHLFFSVGRVHKRVCCRCSTVVMTLLGTIGLKGGRW